jgi:hypothetical protein
MARPRSVDRSIEIKFLADLAQLKAGAKAAEKSLGGLSGSAFQMNNVIGALQMAISMAETAIGVWFELARAASDYDQALGKLNAVFGDADDAITEYAKTSAEAWGQSRTQAINFAGDIGNVFTSMGVTRTEASKMSVATLKLASDMAAFANLPVEEALLAIRSGLVGETEPLRRFGILVYDSAVKAKALAMGIWDGKDAMNDQQKVMARFALMQERGANMTGSFAREVDTLQVQSQKLNAEIENLKVSLGTGGLEDAAFDATKALRGMVIKLDELAESAAKAHANMSPVARDVNDMLRATTITGGFELFVRQLEQVADDADRAAGSFEALNATRRAGAAIEATMSTASLTVTNAIEGQITAVNNQKKAYDKAYDAQQTYLTGMSNLASELTAAFDALDKPTLRQVLRGKWKTLTSDSFEKAIKSGDPERKAQAEYAAQTFGRDLVTAGKKFKPTGNPLVDKWVKKGMEDANWHKSIDTLLSRLQGYLNQNPLTVNISEIMRITGRRGSTSGGSDNNTNTPWSVSPMTININSGVGDPVAIGREVGHVLDAYQARGGLVGR